MTKLEMINDILAETALSETSKNSRRARANQHTKWEIESIYKAFIRDRQNALFWADMI